MDNTEEKTEIQSEEQMNCNAEIQTQTHPTKENAVAELNRFGSGAPKFFRKNRACICWMIAFGLVVASIVILYILHFTQQPEALKAIPVRTGDSQTMIITINSDSIMEHYTLVNLLKNDLETESKKYQKDLQTKSSEFETKYQNYLINVQNNVLTQTQMQNAERQLLQEKEILENLTARYSQILSDKEMSVNNEIMDSLKNVSKRINDARYKADYVFAISSGSAILHANDVYDITDEVIKELNASYKKSTE
ncbi:MAG: OmpH family outer membrane protein [Bacteroidales bacterium]|jgi:outer membrane protein|nr:OmpH family outer membrane protein [Bacteroidales bacterium]